MIIPTLSRAHPSDAPAVVRLRDAAAEWQRSRGIRQWAPGEVTDAQFAERARAGGRGVLARTEMQIALQGKRIARLEVGRKSFDPEPRWHPVTLFEKHLAA